MADVVLWNGNPYSDYTRPERVWIDGALMYDMNDPKRRPVSDFELGQPGEGDVEMIRRVIAALLLAAAAPVGAQTFVISGGTVALGDGSEPIPNGQVVIRDGKSLPPATSG